MKTSYLVASLILATTACSDGGGKKNVNPPVDAPMQNNVDAAPPPCSAPATFTTVMNYVASYAEDTQDQVTGNQEAWRAIGEMDAEVARDLLWIELFEGPAPEYTTANFPATPFTIQLTGAELSYFTCSTCISMTTDVDTMAQEFTYLDDYMATAGSVTITALTPTEITGTLDNVSFKHVQFDFDNGTQTDAASGCTSTIASLAFTAAPEPPMAATGGTKIGIRLPGKLLGKRAR